MPYVIQRKTKPANGGPGVWVTIAYDYPTVEAADLARLALFNQEGDETRVAVILPIEEAS